MSVALIAPTGTPGLSSPESTFDTMGRSFRYVGKAIPLIICLISVKNIVTSSTSLSERFSIKLLSDVKQYLVRLGESITRLISCVLAQITFYLALGKVVLAAAVNLALNLASTILGALFFLWHAVKESIALKETYKTMAVMDKALAGTGSIEDKVNEGLSEYHALAAERARITTSELEKVKPEFVEKARRLLAVDTDNAMEAKFGSHTYKLLKRADLEEHMDKKLEFLQHARKMMRVKEVMHWLETVACVAACVAVIFEFVFPLAGLLVILGWIGWTIAGSGWISSMVVSAVMDKKTQKLLEPST